jgi:di/tricarboxylate transporter
MEPGILIVLAILAVSLVLLAKEVVAAEVVAMGALTLLLFLKILDIDEALSVLSNEAPFTIGALFVLTFALEKTGAIDAVGRFLATHASKNLNVLLLATSSIVGLASAFANNTPIVAFFLPIMLGLARSRNIPASKLLMPLSYAAIMGGCCTLIGTSTNLVVVGILRDHNLPSLGLFDIAPVGIPLMLLGILYLAFIFPVIVPNRQNIIALLSSEERKLGLCQVLVQKDSPLVGKRLAETSLAQRPASFRILEIRRQGARVLQSQDQIVIRGYDRLLITVSHKHWLSGPKGEFSELDPALEQELGIQNLSNIDGTIVEGVVSPHSHLIGQSLRSIRFRQSYGVLVLALHRDGKNISENLADTRLQFGDTLLMVGAKQTFADLKDQGDLMFLGSDLPVTTLHPKRYHAWIALAGTVGLATFTPIPIAAAALLACLFLLVSRCVKPEEAYRSIDWSILFVIYGMLGIGLAMEKTGAAKFLAEHLVHLTDNLVPGTWLPYATLAVIYLLTNILTEILSNNATALVMTPIALNMADRLGLNALPFAIAVMFAASAAYSCPIGYQTHMMVYGPGGYRFLDFIRVGLPLNLIYAAGAIILIPIFFPFHIL